MFLNLSQLWAWNFYIQQCKWLREATHCCWSLFYFWSVSFCFVECQAKRYIIHNRLIKFNESKPWLNWEPHKVWKTVTYADSSFLPMDWKSRTDISLWFVKQSVFPKVYGSVFSLCMHTWKCTRPSIYLIKCCLMKTKIFVTACYH